MTTPPIPAPELRHPWTFAIQGQSSTRVYGEVFRATARVATVELERCAAGRLRDAYPTGSRDIEIRITDAEPAEAVDVLRILTSAVEAADPYCRRVIYAVPADDRSAAEAAQVAGLRYVIDIDLPGIELSLLVAQPDWVTAIDEDLSHVPGT